MGMSIRYCKKEEENGGGKRLIGWVIRPPGQQPVRFTAKLSIIA
jgi:hypothetical protein